jgi:hypothetical protein
VTRTTPLLAWTLVCALTLAAPAVAAPRATLRIQLVGPDGRAASLPPLTTGAPQLDVLVRSAEGDGDAVLFVGSAGPDGVITVGERRPTAGAPTLRQGQRIVLELIGGSQPPLSFDLTLDPRRVTRRELPLPLAPTRSRRAEGVAPPEARTVTEVAGAGVSATFGPGGGRLVGPQGVALVVLPDTVGVPTRVALAAREGGEGSGPQLEIRAEPEEGRGDAATSAAPPGPPRSPIPAIASGVLLGLPWPGGASADPRVLRSLYATTPLVRPGPAGPPATASTVNEQLRGGVVIDGVVWFWWPRPPSGVFSLVPDPGSP